jgi:tetratricopeptide (TPR) repeat protein
MLVYVGNSFFVQGKFAEAVEPYARAFALSPGDYYALSSLGQCYKELRDVRAKETFRDGLSAIEHGGDFRRKRELTTRAVIAAIATLCATECGDGPAAEQWVREGGDLLAGDLIIDGLKPRYFSPRTKRLVSSAELLGELRGYGSV